ncbi:MAG TPA: acyl-ACP--UDP-N-acetylglucosamine O-acyltransferase [Gemmata sp.]|jgi:UDP-N-acetylglucosamine acyltransferase|nr:acyl-ACP--UDP-N-acetylglucosamine O-acyltransferase [Gemmata sp.]
MPGTQTALIHSTAIISPEAKLAENVRVGPYTVIEGPVIVGEGTVIHPHAHLIGPILIGSNNEVGTGTVIGGNPQHLAYKGEATAVEIGDGNIFREYVTVNRAMPVGTGAGSGATRVGNRNLFMACSHVAHDCRIGSDCIFANSSVLGGHVEVGDRALISGNSCVHQFCRVGRLGLLSGSSATSKDIPPFWVMHEINIVCGVNTIGMRRAGLNSVEIQAVRKAFAIIYKERLTIPAALLRIEAEYGQFPAIRELIDFIRSSKRGICGAHRFPGHDEEAAA